MNNAQEWVVLILTIKKGKEALIWFVSECGSRELHSTPGETEDGLIEQWQDQIGPIKRLLRCKTVLSPTDAKMYVSRLRTKQLNNPQKEPAQ